MFARQSLGLPLQFRFSGWLLFTKPVWIALLFIIPSLGQVQKYTGILGVIGYSVICVAVVTWGHKHLASFTLRIISRRLAFILTVCTFAVIIGTFAIIYPQANASVIGGGSDADDALNITAEELLNGRYPYYVRTYLGNRPTPAPGAIFLTIPFYLIGNSAYQNVFWIAVLFLMAYLHFKDPRPALILIWVMFALSPIAAQQLVTGVDYFTNATYLLVFIWLSTNTIVNPQAPIWQKVVAASLLGLALASRLNFFFVVPVLFSFFVQAIGWKMAIRYTGLFMLVSGSIIAPFYIFDPDAYAPLLNARGKLTVIESILPWPAIIVSVLTGLLTIILAAWRMEANGTTLFKQIAIIQYFGVAVIGALLMLAKHTWQFNVNHQFDYGALALPFGAFALVASLDWGSTQVRRKSGIL